MPKKAAQPQDKYVLRLPDGMRDRLKTEADANDRSMNAEIVHRLQGTLEADDTSRDRPLGDYATVINLPGSLRGRIHAEAEENMRTLNAEVVFTLEREYPDLAPINDIVEMLNRSLQGAKKRGSKRDLYELESAISRVYGFYARDLVNEEIKPTNSDYEITPLKGANE